MKRTWRREVSQKYFHAYTPLKRLQRGLSNPYSGVYTNTLSTSVRVIIGCEAQITLVISTLDCKRHCVTILTYMTTDQIIALFFVALYVTSTYGFVVLLFSMWNRESPPETVKHCKQHDDS